jgi:pimeloyl-ACP methyl ester carboxylesterase
VVSGRDFAVGILIFSWPLNQLLPMTTPLSEIREKLIDADAACTDWEGFECWSLPLDELSARFVLPKRAATGNPWFWRPEFFGAFPGADLALLARGWTLGFLDLPDHYGCPLAVEKFAGLHTFATRRLGLAARVAIMALSRGGLSGYHFASEYPEKVCALYADNPVCDFRSWPGGKGKGPGSPEDWQKLLAVYGLSDAEARAYAHQPASEATLRPIVEAGIPVLHVAGDADEVVPYEENTVVLRGLLEKLGGDYREITVSGGKHHPHGLPDPTPIVEFLEQAFGRA